MVKNLDKKNPPLLDHIGWKLWQASQVWYQDFTREMVAAGHTWFGEARAALVPHIARNGTRQSELVAKSGLTKQAVQQLLDRLVEDGIVERRADPQDARGRLICYTRKGMQMLEDARDAKIKIEKKYRSRLGATDFSQLNDALDKLLLTAP